MFKNASAFNQNIGSWNVNNVTAMYSMFQDASAFNQDISNWKVNNVTTMHSMFYSASAFNQPLQYWQVNSNTNITTMFGPESGINLTLSGMNPNDHGLTVPTPLHSEFGVVRYSPTEQALINIDQNDTAETLSNASDNKKRLAIALAKLT